MYLRCNKLQRMHGQRASSASAKPVQEALLAQKLVLYPYEAGVLRL